MCCRMEVVPPADSPYLFTVVALTLVVEPLRLIMALWNDVTVVA